jgi:hypothetical protein
MTTTKHADDKTQDKGQKDQKEQAGSTSHPDKEKSHSGHGDKR